MAADPQLGGQHRPGVRPERTALIELYTAPLAGSTVICADAGPGDPAHLPARARLGRRAGTGSRRPLEYARGPDKTWVYGGLRPPTARRSLLSLTS